MEGPSYNSKLQYVLFWDRCRTAVPFCGIRKGDKVVDLGTGTGIIPVLLAGRMEDACIYGLEIQPDMVEMANRSILLNQLQSRVKLLKETSGRRQRFWGGVNIPWWCPTLLTKN